MLRKTKIVIYIVTAMILMSGCHMKEKIGENITEEVLDSAAGDEADIDIEDGEFTVTDEEGGELTVTDEEGMVFEGSDGSVVYSGGDYEWPDGQAADYLPKFDGGKITYILNSAQVCIITVEETKLEDFDNYVSVVKENGYEKDISESSFDDLQMFSANAEDGIQISISFADGNGILSISVDVSEKQ